MKQEKQEKIRFRDDLVELMFKYDCSVSELCELVNKTNFWFAGTDFKIKKDRILKELLV